MNFFLLFFLFFSPCICFAADSICDIMNLPNCSSINKVLRRSSAKSIPSSGASSQFNPANVSHDRGFGVESFIQSQNPVNFSLVTGTGRSGAALISQHNENTFFANRIIENERDYLIRRLEKKQYRSDKYALALSFALFKRNNFGFDLGLSGKYNKNIKQFNPGAGLSLRLGQVSLGFSQYVDDVFLPKTSYGLDKNFQERFNVQTFFAGVKLGRFFFDAGTISTQFDGLDETFHVRIYSAAFIYHKLLFNAAIREEESVLKKFKDGKLVNQRSQTSNYYGIQYSVHKLLILGLHYNYHLLDEVSSSATLFF